MLFNLHKFLLIYLQVHRRFLCYLYSTTVLVQWISYLLLYFSIPNFPLDFSSSISETFISRELTLTSYSIFIIATSNLSQMIPTSVSSHCCICYFCLCELWSSWFFICQAILDCMLYIFNIMLWKPVSCWNLMKSVSISVLPSNWLSWVQPSNSDLLRYQCHFSLVFHVYLQWTIYELQVSFPLGKYLRVGLLGDTTICWTL